MMYLRVPVRGHNYLYHNILLHDTTKLLQKSTILDYWKVVVKFFLVCTKCLSLTKKVKPLQEKKREKC